MKIIFDTNIYLAAMVNKAGFCFSIFSRVISSQRDHSLFISPDILDELVEKSNELIKKDYVPRADFQTIIKMVYRKVFVITPVEKLKVIKEDSDDDKILECAVASKADLIVTMDHHLIKIKQFRNIGIVHPETFFFILSPLEKTK